MRRLAIVGRRRRLQPYAYVIGAVLTVLFFGRLFYGGGKSAEESESRQFAQRNFRQLTDTRPQECSAAYEEQITDLDQVSVIIFAFLNADSVISQTVASVIVNTNPALLHEILVVLPSQVDKVKVEQLQSELSSYGNLVKTVSSESTKENDIRSRFLVAHVAQAPIVALINDDVIVNEGWLRPLVQELKARPLSIVLPIFDSYDKGAKTLRKVDIPHRWIFDWDLSVRPFEIAYQELSLRNSEADILTSPVMPGHGFAAYKKHLHTLASYKHDMSFSGGLEVSFLNWLCGDGLHIVPCSRMARVGSLRSSPPPDREQADFVAQRYLDAPHFSVYEQVNGAAKLNSEKQRIEEGLKPLKSCKSFDWYMREIARDVFTPSEDTVAYGPLSTNRGPTCFRRTAQMTMVAAPECEISYSSQVVAFNKRGQLRLDENCLKIEQGYALADVCVDQDDTQFWVLAPEYKQLKMKSDTKKCLAHSTDPAEENNKRQVVMLADCETSGDRFFEFQQWDRLRVLTKK